MDIEVANYTKNYVNLLYLAGRGCYGLEKITDESLSEKRKFIIKLIENQHESVLEHVHISILINGCSRSFMAQITRHRLASFSIKSQHYVNHTDFKVKKLESESIEVQTIYYDCVRVIRNRYKQLVNEFNVPIHVAREILPNACLTNIFMTANLREWRYIINLRETLSNTSEMSEFAARIRIMFRKLMPEVFTEI